VGGESLTYTYDAAGIALTSADSTTGANNWGYTYDPYGRLTCAKSGATTCGSTASPTRVTYALDVFSRAHTRTLNTTATTYVYRGVGEQVASATTSGTKTSYARTVGGSPFAQKIGTGAATFYLRDPHGDTVVLVSSAGANLGTTAFDPWGQVLGTSGTQPVFGFQSDLTDALTKAVDMGTRWYGAGTGRFTSRDVVFGDPSHPVSLNQWVYGAANPVTMWDPTGMLVDTAPQGGCGSLNEADCEEAVDRFIAAEEDDPGYWTGSFDGPKVKPPDPPSPETSAPDSQGALNPFEYLYDACGEACEPPTKWPLQDDDDCWPVLGCEVPGGDDLALFVPLALSGGLATFGGKRLIQEGDYKRGIPLLGIGVTLSGASACVANRYVGNNRQILSEFCRYWRDQRDHG
jgi:RHS repeat-associated protein